MRNSPLPQRDRIDSTLHCSIRLDEKRKVFEAAARRGETVSEFVRRVLLNATSDAGDGAATV